MFLRDGLERLESKFDGNSDIIPTDGIEVETLPLELRNSIEADSFWCLTVVLDGIQDNYTFAQPGIQVNDAKIKDHPNELYFVTKIVLTYCEKK